MDGAALRSANPRARLRAGLLRHEGWKWNHLRTPTPNPNRHSRPSSSRPKTRWRLHAARTSVVQTSDYSWAVLTAFSRSESAAGPWALGAVHMLSAAEGFWALSVAAVGLQEQCLARGRASLFGASANFAAFVARERISAEWTLGRPPHATFLHRQESARRVLGSLRGGASGTWQARWAHTSPSR
eukprot:scaffold191249_cov30-Tisochrysis_lutea.AAC.9